MDSNLKLAIFSDSHGNLPEIDKCDYVFICGDISPLDIQRNIVKMKEWIQNVFIKWVLDLPCRQVIIVGGNHDYFIEDICSSDYKILTQIQYPSSNKLKILNNEEYLIYDLNGNEYKVWGSPYINLTASYKIGVWPFMLNENDLRNKFSTMPENCDFVITHDAPYGCSDICFVEHLGNIPLREEILKKQPKYLFHGHLHSSNHECEMLGETKVYNTSILDDSYDNIYPILYICLP